MRAKKIYEEEFKWFKGPSREKIEKALEGRTLEYKFEEAVRNNVLWLVEQYIEEGFDPSYNSNWSIGYASLLGYIEIVKLLLKDTRVDPSSDDNGAIRWASEFGKVEVVKELLKDSRVDPSDLDNYAFKRAEGNFNNDIVKLLLKDKRVIDKLNPYNLIEYSKLGYIK